MNGISFGNTTRIVTREVQWRHRFTILTLLVTVALLAWGGFVTTIEAGMAVPDWPASFGSYDPFKTGYVDPSDPNARWWNSLPVLAEHGHRLLGALVGLLTLLLAGWTWRADPRSWMRKLGLFALFLVVAQGILGGLRVVFNSLDLAVVHACVAQLFFSILVAMTLFTSSGWLRARGLPGEAPRLNRLRTLSLITVGVLFLQIVLGALLRHPGSGLATPFVLTHIAGAFVVAGLVAAVFVQVYRHYWHERLFRRAAASLIGAVVLQFFLGFSAYVVILLERQIGRQSMLQVVLNSMHLVVGAALMASAVSLALLALRRPDPSDSIAPLSSTTEGLRPAGS